MTSSEQCCCTLPVYNALLSLALFPGTTTTKFTSDIKMFHITHVRSVAAAQKALNVYVILVISAILVLVLRSLALVVHIITGIAKNDR